MKNIYFKCHKCGHLIYTDKMEKVLKIEDYECPECGEEGFENWIVVGEKK